MQKQQILRRPKQSTQFPIFAKSNHNNLTTKSRRRFLWSPWALAHYNVKRQRFCCCCCCKETPRQLYSHIIIAPGTLERDQIDVRWCDKQCDRPICRSEKGTRSSICSLEGEYNHMDDQLRDDPVTGIVENHDNIPSLESHFSDWKWIMQSANVFIKIITVGCGSQVKFSRGAYKNILPRENLLKPAV